MDFSNSFKSSTKGFRGKKNQKNGQTKPNDSNKDLEDENMIKPPDEIMVQLQEIPRNLTITQVEMMERKFMDMRRWLSMARPQHPKSCGISSLVSCWNYLYSWLGVGQQRPISTEEALEVLGFKPPYTNVDFGSFTGNETLIQWFALLNKFFKVKG